MSADISTLEHVRRARRLRAQWSAQPARMHAELQKLGSQPAASTPSVLDHLPVMPTHSARAFAVAVEQKMEGPILRYSARQQLLAMAKQRGIDRFQANLMIAAVQHQAMQHYQVDRSHLLLPTTGQWVRRWVPTLAIFTAVQAMVGWAIWMVVHH